MDREIVNLTWRVGTRPVGGNVELVTTLHSDVDPPRELSRVIITPDKARAYARALVVAAEVADGQMPELGGMSSVRVSDGGPGPNVLKRPLRPGEKLR